MTCSKAKEQLLDTSIHESENMDTEYDLVNLSTVTRSFRDDSKKITFINDNDLGNDNDIEEESEKCNIVKQKKYLCSLGCDVVSATPLWNLMILKKMTQMALCCVVLFIVRICI